jgi:hypothetical protein
MRTYAEALTEFYSGEVTGEAIYSNLLGWAASEDQRLKLATILQLETETKAWLRPYLLAQGISVEERAADREKGAGIAAQVKPLSWPQLMKGTINALETQLIPFYQSFADAAKARGSLDEEQVCLHMVEHERAQLEFARRELAGDSRKRALAPIMQQLRYPIPA